MGDYLIHHGVKGMKWGIRKQYEAVGRRRVGSPKSKALRGRIVADRYMKSSDPIADEKRAKRRKAIAAGVAVAATALAVYGGYKLYGKRPSDMLTYGVDEPLSKMLSHYPSKDITINGKTTMQRVSADSFLDLKSRLYLRLL